MRTSILLASVLLLGAATSTAWCQSGGSYAISNSTIDGGGGSSSGGNLRLRGTIGQADASVQAATGGDYAIHGGFWTGGPAASTSTGVFADGFEAPAPVAKSRAPSAPSAPHVIP